MSIYVNAFLYQVQALYYSNTLLQTALPREPERTGILARVVNSNRFGSLCMMASASKCLERLERLDPLEHDSDFW